MVMLWLPKLFYHGILQSNYRNIFTMEFYKVIIEIFFHGILQSNYLNIFTMEFRKVIIGIFLPWNFRK